MSERGVGFNVTATRQNAGSAANALAPPRPPRPPGCVNAPGATFCASVTVVFGSDAAVRLSHVAASAYVEHTIAISSTAPVTASLCIASIPRGGILHAIAEA